MSDDLNQRLRVLGDHLEQERLAAAEHGPIVQVVPIQHATRGRTLVIAAAVALVAFGVGAALTSRNAPVAPSAAECPTATAPPSTFDGGVAMIVWVHKNATDDQIAAIRNAISDHPDVIDSTRIEYLDDVASAAEAGRIFANDPGALEQLLPEIPTLFKLFTTPTADPSALRDLVSQFEKLPMVLRVQIAPDLSDGQTPSGVPPAYLPPDTTG